MVPIEAATDRLLLRQWRESDREPFARLNADPRVMQHFPAPLAREASDQLMDRIQSGFATRGWSLWAAEVRASGEFIGFIGLSAVAEAMPFHPAVEVGWRLAAGSWGQGYATEGARAALDLGFERLGLAEIVSFTAVGNRRSRAVMERLGMALEPAPFEHPGLSEGHSLREHCLYRITRNDALPLLETARLRLRRFTTGDAAFVLALLTDPQWLRFIGDRGVRDEDGARAYLEKGPIAMYRRHGFGSWLVERKVDGMPVGMCGLIQRDTLPDVDLGFAFLPEHRGQGYAFEAAQASLDYGRRVYRLQRIVAIATPENTASSRLLERLGFRREGPFPWKGERDLDLYATGAA